jgi:hypothetical protein
MQVKYINFEKSLEKNDRRCKFEITIAWTPPSKEGSKDLEVRLREE